MSLKKLVEDKSVQEILKQKLTTGEKFELISVGSKEKMNFEELKQNIA